MQYTTAITTRFHCSIERAFKTPMLCDVTKVHTGYLLMPRVTHCTEDETWGKINGSRKVFMARNFYFKGGEAALDKVLERIENKYWKIEISDFKYWAMGFTKFQGEWLTRENPDGTIEVRYVYTLFSNAIFAYPFHWFITKIIWRTYMKHVLHNVQQIAYNNTPYLHE